MYVAKQLGGNRYNHCMEDMGSLAEGRFHVVAALEAALERQEFRLHFQPQVSVASSAIQSVEALLRWQHPEQGLIGPETFIATAENSELIEPLDAWVLRTACAQLKRWQAAGLPPLRLAINLSSRQLVKPGLSALCRVVLEQAGLSPGQLELEVKEPALLENYAASAANLADLKELGITVRSMTSAMAALRRSAICAACRST